MSRAPRSASQPGALPRQHKRLRVALVRDGRIFEERILERGEPLTVGPTERSVFVVATLPRTVTLITWTGSGSVASRTPTLHLSPGMRARMAGADEMGAEAGPIALDSSTRGRVRVGDAWILFQLVDAPERSVAPLPKELRELPLHGLDVRTTVIAAFSFLLHFGAIGTAYAADLGDASIEDDGLRLTHTVSLISTLPPLPPVETHDEATTPAPDARAAPSKTAPPTSHGPPANPSRGSITDANQAPRVSDVRAAGIARELDALGGVVLERLVAKGEGSTDRVLLNGSVPSSFLEASASDARGTTVNPLGFGASSGVVRPGEATSGHGLGDLVHTDREKSGEATRATAPAVKPPRVMGAAEVAVGKVPDAGRVIGSLKGQLRACYRHELDVNPEAKGTIRITLSVGANGEIQSAQVVPSGSLSSSMVSCVTRVARGAQFGAPEGGSALVAAPFTFFPQ